MSKCVVRIHQKDAVYLCKEFGKLDELGEVVTKKKQFVPISLTGGLTLVKLFDSYNYKTKITRHTYYLFGKDRNEVTTIQSTRCGRRIRGCFIPIPNL